MNTFLPSLCLYLKGVQAHEDRKLALGYDICPSQGNFSNFIKKYCSFLQLLLANAGWVSLGKPKEAKKLLKAVFTTGRSMMANLGDEQKNHVFRGNGNPLPGLAAYGEQRL